MATILKNITLVKFKNEYLSWSSSTQRKNSFIIARQSFRKFFLFFISVKESPKKIMLEDVIPRHIDLFLAFCKNDGLKATSANAYFRHLKAAFSKAVYWDYLENNPFLKIKQLKIEKKQPSFIPIEEIGAFLRSIKDFDKRMLITAYLCTGRRRCELLELKWSDINFDKRKYRVELFKSHITKDFPINDIFLSVLNKLLLRDGTDRPNVFWKWTEPNSVTYFVKKELKRSGYGELKLHDLRHSFASAYLTSHGDLFALKELLGHSDITTTMIYSHLTKSHLSEENNKLDFK